MLTSFRFILRIVLHVKWSHFWNTGNVVDYCKSDFVQWRSDHNHFKSYISHFKAALVTSLVDSSDYFVWSSSWSLRWLLTLSGLSWRVHPSWMCATYILLWRVIPLTNPLTNSYPRNNYSWRRHNSDTIHKHYLPIVSHRGSWTHSKLWRHELNGTLVTRQPFVGLVRHMS